MGRSVAVEVRTERQHHRHPAPDLVQGAHQRRDELLALVRVVGLGEQLLDLVDDHGQLGAGGHGVACQVDETSTIDLEADEHVGCRGADHGCQGRGELDEGPRSRRHDHRRPGLAARQRATTQCGQHAGLHDGRLAAPRRAHHRHEAVAADPGHELGDERRPTEEAGPVLGLERRQALATAARPQPRPRRRPHPPRRRSAATRSSSPTGPVRRRRGRGRGARGPARCPAPRRAGCRARWYARSTRQPAARSGTAPARAWPRRTG